MGVGLEIVDFLVDRVLLDVAGVFVALGADAFVVGDGRVGSEELVEEIDAPVAGGVAVNDWQQAAALPFLR